MDYSKLLKRIRSKMLLSQMDLAKELGISFATVNRIEGGLHEPSFSTKRKIREYCKSIGLKN